MNCLEDENICSVKKENDLGYYRLHTFWKKDGFFINIASKNGAWRGEMTLKDITKMSVQLEMEPDSYLRLCKEVLTCEGGQSGIVYAVENGCFTWKKVEDEDSGIKVKMGSVVVEPTDFVDTIQNIITAALNCNKNLQEQLKKITEEKEKILENNHELLNKLNELIKSKEAMENDLYARFLLVINAKKKKIQELGNFLEEKLTSRKSTKLKNSANPYEVDTETDSEDDIQKDRVKKTKVKNKKKFVEPNDQLSAESPKEKKIKNCEDEKEDFSRGTNFSKCPSSLLIEPSSFKNSENGQEESQKTTSSKALTKDELYDFFYGEF